MANRVVLGAFDGTYVLRVSRPGFNVLSTGLTRSQLSFDSRWPETGNELLSGSFSINTSNTVTINFGTTLADVPIVSLRVRGSDGASYIAHSAYDDSMLSTTHFSLEVSTSQFSFRKGWPYPTDLFGGTSLVAYNVFRNVF